MLVLFACTLFANAFLLFLIQPMISRMILPLLGGTPAVWTTCMLFFQAVLLGGYLYSHLVTTRLSPRRQVMLHALVLLLPLLALPIGLDRARWLSDSLPPSVWLLGLLTLTIAPPFFAVATSAPLLQRWFSWTGHAHAKDPYFFYAASNLGNMLALLCYPTLLEPRLRLVEQSNLWAWGYAALVALTFACSMTILRAAGTDASASHEETRALPLAWQERARWVALAFVPSSLMLGLTTYITTDVSAIPLLWLIPLTLYLLTFIIAFANLGVRHRARLNAIAPFAALFIYFIAMSRLDLPIWVLYLFHLAAFFLIALVCHGELAVKRPAVAHLTEFYLWISVGGMLGGLFNAIAAPLVFSTVLEYPLTCLIACFLVPAATRKVSVAAGRRMEHQALGAAALGLALFFLREHIGELAEATQGRLIASAAVAGDSGFPVVQLGLPLVASGLLCYAFHLSAAQFRLVILSLCLATVAQGSSMLSSSLYQDRSFFGVVSVLKDDEGEFHELRHGTTIHGRQSLVEGRRGDPISYYHPRSPVGEILGLVGRRYLKPDVAVLGLGVGTAAALAKPGHRMTFYEIDPAVVKVARDPALFTFLGDAEKRGVGIDVVLGDARLKIKDAPAAHFGLILADAFSSDSVPLHLISVEALQLYLSKLDATGVIGFHISNKHLDLKPVVERLAKAAGMYGVYRSQDEDEIENDVEYLDSEWIALSRTPDPLVPLTALGGWEPLGPGDDKPVWRDDYANLLGAVMWFEESEPVPAKP